MVVGVILIPFLASYCNSYERDSKNGGLFSFSGADDSSEEYVYEEPETDEDKIERLEAVIEELEAKIEDIDSKFDDVEANMGGLETAIGEFGYDEWKYVVPKVKTNFEDLEFAIDDLETAIDY